MKVEKIRDVLERASRLHLNDGAKQKADALLKLAEFLRDYDSKTVAAFMKAHKAKENRAKSSGGLHR
jgi:hypothetical protein